MARKANREMWEGIIASQKISGIPQIKWCQENNVNIHNFRYWVGRLKDNKVTTSGEWVTLSALEVYGMNVMSNSQKHNSSISITVGKAVVEYTNNQCIDSLDKVIQVLMKYV